MTTPTVAIIDLDALQHNLQNIKQRARNTNILAILKANAYGHDLISIAKALPQVEGFGIARLSEAERLREAGIKQKIVLLTGAINQEQLTQAISQQCDLVIHHPEQLHLLKNNPAAQNQQIWLKMDIGMHRLGFPPAECQQAWQALQKMPLKYKPILMGHFSQADHTDSTCTQAQYQLFEQYSKILNGQRSIANSAAILAHPETHCDWIRPGLMLYGVSPFQEKDANAYELKPVMTLQSSLIAIKQCQQGDRLGYGGDWSCPEDMNVGVVAIGYGDGYPREIVPDTPVLINQKRANIIGRVSMDLLSIDLRQHPNAKIGDPIILWGNGLPVEEIARRANTIPYTLLCGIAQRVPHILK